MSDDTFMALSVNRRLPISKVAEDGRVCHMH